MVSIAGPRRVALTASTCQGLLAPSHGGHLSGRAARGSVALRKMACRPAVGFIFSVQGHQRAHMSSFGPCPVADFFLGGPVTGEGTAKGWLRGA
jgi:hypothetical protein